MDIKLIEKTQDEQVKEKFAPGDLRDKPLKVKEYKADKAELSDAIKKFDAKPRTRSFNYNDIALGKKDSIPSSLTAFQMITDPTYNTVGKFLGVNTLHEWGKSYDKVETIVAWARKKTGSTKIEKLLDFLNGASNFVPTFDMNQKKIDQIHLYAKLQLTK